MRLLFSAALVIVLSTNSALAVSTSSVSFQNGVDGYTGTFDRRISERINQGPTFEFDGSTVNQYFIDGYTGGATPSPDEQALIRFDNLFGTGPRQIPLGATILSAELQLTTSSVGNADTNGPVGVAALKQAFDSNTSYFTNFPSTDPLGSRGAWWQDGYSDRPSGAYGQQGSGTVGIANVRSIVQGWSSGKPNHGVAVQMGFTGSTNAWSTNSTSHPVTMFRPKLSVTYTTDPVEINTFQDSVAGHNTTMAWVRSGLILATNATNPDATVDDVTYNSKTGEFTLSPTSTLPGTANPPVQLTQFQQFLDGPNFTDSPDDLALIKFNNLFGTADGQAPSDKKVETAWLVLTTGDLSGNARSTGNWSVYSMKRDWSPSTLYSQIGATPGLQESDGDISAAVTTVPGMTTGSEVWLDVTSYAEAVRTGTPDFGLAVAAVLPNADGWQIHFTGSDEAFRPRLVMISDLSAAPAGVPGDYNDDGTVDAADYVLWRNGGPLENEGASTGAVDQADYDFWRSRFGATSGSGTGLTQTEVPEPTTSLLLIIGSLAMAVKGSRKCKS